MKRLQRQSSQLSSSWWQQLDQEEEEHDDDVHVRRETREQERQQQQRTQEQRHQEPERRARVRLPRGRRLHFRRGGARSVSLPPTITTSRKTTRSSTRDAEPTRNRNVVCDDNGKTGDSRRSRRRGSSLISSRSKRRNGQQVSFSLSSSSSVTTSLLSKRKKSSKSSSSSSTASSSGASSSRTSGAVAGSTTNEKTSKQPTTPTHPASSFRRKGSVVVGGMRRALLRVRGGRNDDDGDDDNPPPDRVIDDDDDDDGAVVVVEGSSSYDDEDREGYDLDSNNDSYHLPHSHPALFLVPQRPPTPPRPSASPSITHVPVMAVPTTKSKNMTREGSNFSVINNNAAGLAWLKSTSSSLYSTAALSQPSLDHTVVFPTTTTESSSKLSSDDRGRGRRRRQSRGRRDSDDNGDKHLSPPQRKNSTSTAGQQGRRYLEDEEIQGVDVDECNDDHGLGTSTTIADPIIDINERLLLAKDLSKRRKTNMRDGNIAGPYSAHFDSATAPTSKAHYDPATLLVGTTATADQIIIADTNCNETTEKHDIVEDPTIFMTTTKRSVPLKSASIAHSGSKLSSSSASASSRQRQAIPIEAMASLSLSSYSSLSSSSSSSIRKKGPTTIAEWRHSRSRSFLNRAKAAVMSASSSPDPFVQETMPIQQTQVQTDDYDGDSEEQLSLNEDSFTQLGIDRSKEGKHGSPTSVIMSASGSRGSSDVDETMIASASDDSPLITTSVFSDSNVNNFVSSSTVIPRTGSSNDDDEAYESNTSSLDVVHVVHYNFTLDDQHGDFSMARTDTESASQPIQPAEVEVSAEAEQRRDDNNSKSTTTVTSNSRSSSSSSSSSSELDTIMLYHQIMHNNDDHAGIMMPRDNNDQAQEACAKQDFEEQHHGSSAPITLLPSSTTKIDSLPSLQNQSPGALLAITETSTVEIDVLGMNETNGYLNNVNGSPNPSSLTSWSDNYEYTHHQSDKTIGNHGNKLDGDIHNIARDTPSPTTTATCTNVKKHVSFGRTMEIRYFTRSAEEKCAYYDIGGTAGAGGPGYDAACCTTSSTSRRHTTTRRRFRSALRKSTSCATTSCSGTAPSLSSSSSSLASWCCTDQNSHGVPASFSSTIDAASRFSDCVKSTHEKPFLCNSVNDVNEALCHVFQQPTPNEQKVQSGVGGQNTTPTTPMNTATHSRELDEDIQLSPGGGVQTTSASLLLASSKKENNSDIIINSPNTTTTMDDNEQIVVGQEESLLDELRKRGGCAFNDDDSGHSTMDTSSIDAI